MGRGDQRPSAGRHGESFWDEEAKTNKGYAMMSSMGWDRGKGLGKTNQGSTKFIRALKKKDSSGIGAKEGDDENWTAVQGVFNDLLKRLNAAGTNNVNEGGKADMTKQDKPESTGKTLKSFMVKRRLYGRFKRAKDTDKYSAVDKAAIFGARPEDSVTSKKHEGDYGVVKEITDEEISKKSGVVVNTSKLSIRDYFAQKMAASAKKTSAFSVAGGKGFTEQFQTSYAETMSDVSGQYKGTRRGLGTASASGATSAMVAFHSAGQGGGAGAGGLGFKAASTKGDEDEPRTGGLGLGAGGGASMVASGWVGAGGALGTGGLGFVAKETKKGKKSKKGKKGTNKKEKGKKGTGKKSKKKDGKKKSDKKEGKKKSDKKEGKKKSEKKGGKKKSEKKGGKKKSGKKGKKKKAEEDDETNGTTKKSDKKKNSTKKNSKKKAKEEADGSKKNSKKGSKKNKKRKAEDTADGKKKKKKSKKKDT